MCSDFPSPKFYKEKRKKKRQQKPQKEGKNPSSNRNDCPTRQSRLRVRARCRVCRPAGTGRPGRRLRRELQWDPGLGTGERPGRGQLRPRRPWGGRPGLLSARSSSGDLRPTDKREHGQARSSPGRPSHRRGPRRRCPPGPPHLESPTSLGVSPATPGSRRLSQPQTLRRGLPSGPPGGRRLSTARASVRGGGGVRAASRRGQQLRSGLVAARRPRGPALGTPRADPRPPRWSPGPSRRPLPANVCPSARPTPSALSVRSAGRRGGGGSTGPRAAEAAQAAGSGAGGSRRCRAPGGASPSPRPPRVWRRRSGEGGPAHPRPRQQVPPPALPSPPRGSLAGAPGRLPLPRPIRRRHLVYLPPPDRKSVV